ncbi:MAG: phosphatidylglycerol lysyltransferase domain-containing protein [Candidatus Omnitrophota bacterium]
MFADFPAFVPSEYCLSCRGCCRFSSGEDPWRPLTAAEERCRNQLSYPQSSQTEMCDPQGFLKTADDGMCLQLEPEEHRCLIYEARPLECRIYPFMLVRHGGRVVLAAHLSCPYIQENWQTPSYERYAEGLRKYLRRQDVYNYFFRNPAMIREYELDDQELDVIAEWPVLDPVIDPKVFRRRSELARALKDAGSRDLSAYAFPAVAMWEPFFAFDAVDISGSVCLFATDRLGTFLYFPPLAKSCSAETIDAAFACLRQINLHPAYVRMEHVPFAIIETLDAGRYRWYEREPEVIYCRKEIAALAGRPYKNRRHEYNVCAAQHRMVFRPYQPRDYEACLSLYERWAEQKTARNLDDVVQVMLEENRIVHAAAVRDAQRLGLVGRIAECNGHVVGYTFGYSVSEKTFCVVFEIADPGVRGLPAYLFREFCRDPVLQDFEKINVMDSFASPRLEQTKQTYRPHQQAVSYVVYSNEI